MSCVASFEMFLFSMICLISPVHGQALSPDDAISRLTAQELKQSLIALVNLSSVPSISGMWLRVDTGDGQPDLQYNKLNVHLPIAWPTPHPKLDLYTEFAFGWLSVSDEFFASNNRGELTFLDANRDVYSIRVGIGIEYHPAPRWRITPLIASAFSQLTSDTAVKDGRIDFGNLTPVERAALTAWDVKASTLAMGLQVKYDHWFVPERYRLELEGKYAHSYTRTFNESLPILQGSGHTNTLLLSAQWTTITQVKSFGKPLAWNVFINNTTFLDQDTDVLGFRSYFGAGGSLEWYIKYQFFRERFRLNFVGLRLEGIVGEHVTGGSISISLRN